jgi:hypothetical protein
VQNTTLMGILVSTATFQNGLHLVIHVMSASWFEEDRMMRKRDMASTGKRTGWKFAITTKGGEMKIQRRLSLTTRSGAPKTQRSAPRWTEVGTIETDGRKMPIALLGELA